MLIAVGAGTAALGQQPAAPPAPPAGAVAPPASDSSPAAVEDKPSRRWPSEVVILEGAADAAEFWKKLAAPDWIIARPAPGRIGEAPRAEGGAAVANIDEVRVSGAVEGETARLVLDIHAELFVDGPTWVPLGLTVPVVPSAREGDRELDVRRPEGGPWEARLEGARGHRLRIEAVAPVRVGSQRRTLELAVPEASATSFDLMLPRRAIDVDLGTGEIVPKPEPVEGRGLRLAAHVRPRSRLELSWSEQDAAGPRAAPLLSAQVEMAVDVDAEGVSVRSSWAVSCSRGVARSLQIRLGEDEEVAGVRLNDQFQASGIERSGGANLLTIPLSEPLRAGESRRLVLETRRPIAGAGTLEFAGYPLTDAGEQSGFLGVTQGPNLFVSVSRARGLRRIDPRDLPTALKTRLGTAIAMQFGEQPFELSLGVEPAPPLFRVDASARLSIDPDGVRNETTLDVERVRGTLYEIEVATPPGLKVTSIGPAELVEAAAAPRPGEAGGGAGARSLRIRLTPQARDRSAFGLTLVGRQDPVEPGDVRLGLFAPRGAVATTTTLAVSAGVDVALEPLDETLVKEPAADPPATRAEAGAPPTLRLRTSRNPTALDLRLERRAMAIRRETSLSARVSRRAIEVRQETNIRVRHGAPTSLVVLTPPGVAPGWEASDGQRPLRKEELDEPSSGVRRARLTFDRPVSDASLTFHFRVPLGRPLTSEGPTAARIPWIAIEAGEPGPCTIAVATDPDVAAAVDDPAWSRVEPVADGREPLAYRLERDDAADALAATARLVEPVAMPAVVASRAFVRSSLDADGGLRVRAWYAVESHPRSLSVALPPGASWLRVRVDGQAVDRIDATGEGGETRIDLPAESAERPVLLDLEYRAPAASARRPWSAPTLLGGAEVLQTYWLAQVPWTLVAPVPPRGWTDEGRWAWDGFAASRRPVASASRLAAWAAGPAATAAALDETPEGDDAARGLLYSRPGPPTPMAPRLVSRAGAVLACSGLALLAALALTFFPSRAPWVAGAAAVAGLPAAMYLPAGAWAFAMQASVFGVALGLAIFLGRRLAAREAPAPAGGPSRVTAGSSLVAPGSSFRSASEVGSDDSTAIRSRPSTTMDYLAAPPPPGPDPDASLATRRPRGLPLE